MKNLLSLILHIVEVPTQQELAAMPLDLRSAHEEVARVTRIQNERNEGAVLCGWMLHWAIPLLTGRKAPSVHTMKYAVYCQGGYIHATDHSLRESDGRLSFLTASSTKDYLQLLS